MDTEATFRVEPADGETARFLVAAMVAEMWEMYPDAPADVFADLAPESVAPPVGAFVVGWSGDEAVAGGALRFWGEGIAEIKRMYVHPDHRRRGLAAGLLAALEAEAVRLGYRVVRLDTGPRQDHARRLYERSGYRRIPSYGAHSPATYFGEKSLV